MVELLNFQAAGTTVSMAGCKRMPEVCNYVAKI